MDTVVLASAPLAVFLLLSLFYEQIFLTELVCHFHLFCNQSFEKRRSPLWIRSCWRAPPSLPCTAPKPRGATSGWVGNTKYRAYNSLFRIQNLNSKFLYCSHASGSHIKQGGEYKVITPYTCLMVWFSFALDNLKTLIFPYLEFRI